HHRERPIAERDRDHRAAREPTDRTRGSGATRWRSKRRNCQPRRTCRRAETTRRTGKTNSRRSVHHGHSIPRVRHLHWSGSCSGGNRPRGPDPPVRSLRSLTNRPFATGALFRLASWVADRPKRTDIAAAPHPDVDLVTETQIL